MAATIISDVTSTTSDSVSGAMDLTTVVDLINSTTADIIRGGNAHKRCVVVNSSMLGSRDESGDLVTIATVNVFTIVRGTVLFPVFFFLGFPSNVLNMAVFYKQGLSHRINLCLFVLALVDLLYVTFIFVFYVDNLRPDAFSSQKAYQQLGPVASGVANSHLLGLFGLGWASIFLTAVVAAERCFCVLLPLKSRELFKTRSTAVVLVVGVALLVAGRSVVTAKYAMTCIYDVATDVEITQLLTSPFYARNKEAVDFLDAIVYGFAIPLTVIVVVVISNVITVVKLHQAVSFRSTSANIRSTTSKSAGSGGTISGFDTKGATSGAGGTTSDAERTTSGAGKTKSGGKSWSLSPKEVALTRMSIFLSLQCVIFTTPNMVLRIAQLFLPQLSYAGKWGNFYFLMVGVVELDALVNSSINFLGYALAGSKYREAASKILASLFCFCCRGTNRRRLAGFGGYSSSAVGNSSGIQGDATSFTLQTVE